MSIQTNVKDPYQQLEYQKFVEIQNDSNFPPVSVIYSEYADSSTASVSAMKVFPKYAVLTYDVSSGAVNSQPFGDNASSDAFGRLRTSSPNTLLDAKQLYGTRDYLFDQVRNGTGDSLFTLGDSCINMTTLNSGDYVIRQTKQRFNYSPGKSIQALMTGTLGTQTNILKRVGLFTGSFTAPYNPVDGIYLENNSGYVSLNIVKTLGTANTESIPQSAWNVDKLDGTGSSGITLDLSKTNIFTLDYEWLGVGRVRAGFIINGKFYYVHYFNHANIFNNVYMSFPNQPVRYEIRQTGENIPGGSMKHICSTVISEGGDDEVGTPISVDFGSDVQFDTTLRPFLGFRINKAYSNKVVNFKTFELMNVTGNVYAAFYVYLNPTITGTFNYTNSAGSIEFAKGSGAETMSGGTLLYSGVLPKDTSTGQLDFSKKFSSLGIGISGNYDNYVVGIKTYSSNGKFGGVCNFLERG
jgi:hypothetical protein